MEFLFELLLNFIGELLLQVVIQVLIEVGLHSLAAVFERKPNPGLAAIGYALLGAVAGGLTLWAFPSLFIRSHAGRVVNVVVTPLIAGGCMVAIGRWRSRRDQQLVLLDRFAYGTLFALAMALVRLWFGG